MIILILWVFFIISWSKRYHEAETSTTDRNSKKELLMDEIEKDLVLLGATAIEDKLQDGVPDTLECLHESGIKVRIHNSCW